MSRQEPPEKRRKTVAVTDDLWDDDTEDEVFSQAVLQDIDHIIESQQAPPVAIATSKHAPSAIATNSQQASAAVETNNNAKPGADTEHACGKLAAINQLSLQSKSQGYHTMPNGRATGHSTQRSGQGSQSHSLKTQPTVRSQVKSAEPRASLQTCPPPLGSCAVPGSAPANQRPAFSRTSQGACTSGIQFTHAMKQKLAAVEEENTFLKEENQKLKGAQYGKDGQIKYLRTKLAQLESERFKDKQEKVQKLEQQSKEQSEREKRLEKEVDKTKTMLQFKEHELDELKERCRRQEKQLRSGEGTSPVRPGPLQSPARSPARSPRTRPTESPRASSRVALDFTSRSGPEFPNKSTFMKEEGSPRKQRQEVTMEQGREGRQVVMEVDKGTQMSTPDTLTAPERPCPQPRMRLRLSHAKGKISGSQLIGKLIESSASLGTDAASKDAKLNQGASHSGHEALCLGQGVFSLLQEPPEVMDVSGLRLERDASTFAFKPIAPLRNTSATAEVVTMVTRDRESYQQSISLASQAISQLLQESGHDCHQPGEGTACLPYQPGPQAVLLLPLLESCLDIYLDTMLSLNNKANTSSSTCSESTAGGAHRGDSVASVTLGVQSLSVRGASYVNAVESRTICALKVLHKLATYSAHVRLVLNCDKQWNGARLGPQPGDGAGEGTSQNSMEAGEGHEQDRQTLELSQLDNSARQVARNCGILNKLLQLANPLQPDCCLGNVWVTSAALRVLSALVQSAPSNTSRMLPLFSQESLLNCICERNLMKEDGGIVGANPVVTLVTAAIDLLTSLIESSSRYLEHLCSKNDDCLLLALYHLCVHTIDELELRTRVHICMKVYRCLSALLSCHRTASTLVFDSACRCSSQIIRCLVLTLARELYAQRDQKQNPTLLPSRHVCSNFLAFLQQGLLLLQALTMRDRLFTSHHQDGCKHQFVQLMCEVHRLLNALPESPEKHLMLGVMPDLWDLDMDYPDSAEQTLDPQLFNKMDIECSSTPKANRKLPADSVIG